LFAAIGGVLNSVVTKLKAPLIVRLFDNFAVPPKLKLIRFKSFSGTNPSSSVREKLVLKIAFSLALRALKEVVVAKPVLKKSSTLFLKG